MESNDKPFDMTEHWNTLASAEDNTVKGELFRLLYRIEGICQQNWNTMPGDVQSQIIDAVQTALEAVRSLPSNTK